MANLRVGSVEVVPLLDVPLKFPFANVFPDVPASAWAEYERLYPAAGRGAEFFTNASVYALRSGGQTLVVDAGIGAGMGGKLDADLKAKGIDPAAVDIVVFTHLHIDHVGWAVRDGKPFFPRARHLVPRADWEFFRAPERRAENAHVVAMEAIEKAGMVELVEGERAVTDSVTLLPTPGHTPGHQSLLVFSGGERAYLTGDIVHHPAQVQETAWCPAFDNDKPTATASRRRLLDRIAAEAALMVACHFPNPGIGRLAESGGRRIFQAMEG